MTLDPNEFYKHVKEITTQRGQNLSKVQIVEAFPEVFGHCYYCSWCNKFYNGVFMHVCEPQQLTTQEYYAENCSYTLRVVFDCGSELTPEQQERLSQQIEAYRRGMRRD